MKTILKNENGSALITTFWIMTILSLFAMGIGFRVSLELRLSKYYIDRLSASYLAKAGFEKASALLLKDSNEYDSIYECGIALTGDETPEMLFGSENNPLGKGSFSIYYMAKDEFEEGEKKYYGMLDEERKINIKLSKLEGMGDYRSILKRLSPDNFRDEVIDGIRDWQDGEGAPDGDAEDSYYKTLEPPRECKNSELECIEELLLIKDVSPEIFNNIKDYVTIYGEGKININTAPKEVLNAVINNDEGKYSGLVGKIINYRKGGDGKECTEDDNPIKNLNDIPHLEPDESARLSSLANFFCFTSDNFRIISHGTVGTITKTIDYVVKRTTTEGENAIQYYREE